MATCQSSGPERSSTTGSGASVASTGPVSALGLSRADKALPHLTATHGWPRPHSRHVAAATSSAATSSAATSPPPRGRRVPGPPRPRPRAHERIPGTRRDPQHVPRTRRAGAKHATYNRRVAAPQHAPRPRRAQCIICSPASSWCRMLSTYAQAGYADGSPSNQAWHHARVVHVYPGTRARLLKLEDHLED